MNIIPLRNFVLVELSDEDAPSASGLTLVKLERDPSTQAVVLAIGPEVRDTRVGQRVIVSRLQGINVDGRVLLAESAVLGVLEDA